MNELLRKILFAQRQAMVFYGTPAHAEWVKIIKEHKKALMAGQQMSA